MRPFVVEWTTAVFELEIGMDVIDGAFLRNDSKSRKWLENDESKNGRCPMPNARNGWLLFGPDDKIDIINVVKTFLFPKIKKKKNEKKKKPKTSTQTEARLMNLQFICGFGI